MPSFLKVGFFKALKQQVRWRPDTNATFDQALRRGLDSPEPSCHSGDGVRPDGSYTVGSRTVSDNLGSIAPAIRGWGLARPLSSKFPDSRKLRTNLLNWANSLANVASLPVINDKSRRLIC